MKLRSTLLSLLIAFGLSVATPAGAQHGYKRVSVCEVLTKPSENYHRYVVIDAALVSARPHGVVLVDQRCSGKGLLLDFPSAGSDRSVKDLENAIRNGDLSANGNLSLESMGTFSGKIKRDPATKRLVLSLYLVKNLQPKGASTIPPG